MTAFERALPAVLILAAGCSGDSYTAAMEARAKAQEEILSILRTIKDPATMQAASETLEQSFARLAETNERMNKMHPPSMEIKEQLAREYLPRFQTAIRDSQRELERIRDIPGGQEFIERLKNLK